LQIRCSPAGSSQVAKPLSSAVKPIPAFAACRFAVTRTTDVHLKREAGAAPGKQFQRYLDRLASVHAHLAAADRLLAL